MMIVRWLIALALLLPAAAADGLTTRVNYVDENDSCYGDSYSNETSGPGWWRRSSGWSSSCYDSFEYAGAHAWTDDGMGAGARAYSSQGDHHSGSSAEESRYWSDNSSYGDASQYREAWSSSAHWSRGASLYTHVASADVNQGCGDTAWSSSRGDGESRAWQAGDSTYHSSQGSRSETESHSNGCAQSASANAAGEHVGAGHANGCRDARYSYGDWQSSSYNGSGTESSWHAAGWNSDCGSRVGLDSPVTALAGLGNSCSSSSFGHTQSWWSTSPDGNSTYDSYGSSYDQAHCRDGAFGNGPDGMSLFAGRDYRSDSWCDTSGDCESGTYESYGVELVWEHNPLGPHPVTVFVPGSLLPSLPTPALP